MADGSIVLADRYELGERLGRGGMADVFRGVDRRLGRPVAVKRLKAELADDPECRSRFEREVQAAASLNHPMIAAVYDTGSEPDPVTGLEIPYLVMELVDGSTLRSILDDGPRPTPARALELVTGVLSALDHAHHTGIVHRDIKPANVMVTGAGAVKVMDFGIAGSFGGDAEHPKPHRSRAPPISGPRAGPGCSG